MDCARCGRKFFLHSPINALWCDHDQFFICRRCAVGGGRHAPMRCPQCDRPIRNSVPAVMVFAVIFLGISLILAPITYLEATSRQALAATPRAEIAQLVDGETVMIYGNIATSAHAPTLDAYWVSTGKSGYWHWTDYPFELYQGSMGINVVVVNLGDSVYGAPFETNSNEWYEPADSIAIIGTVSGSNGSWEINAEDAAPSPGGFADPTALEIGEGAFAAAGLFGVLIAVGWVIGIRRFQAHNARERTPGMYDYRPPVAPPPPTDPSSGALPP